jgi:hypothetical protein
LLWFGNCPTVYARAEVDGSVDVIRWEKVGLRRDAVRFPFIHALEAQEIKETSTEGRLVLRFAVAGPGEN